MHLSRALVMCLAGCLPLAASFKVTPTSLTFTYQTSQSKLPAAQNLAISSTTASTPLSFTASISGGPWLSISPDSGATPVSAKVSVNPSTLSVGTYVGAITLTTTGSTPESLVVAVTLVVKDPPPTLVAAPSPLSLTYVRGDPMPGPLPLTLTTTGALLSYSVKTSGGNWFSTSVSSGIVFPGFASTVEVTVNPANMMPGSYKGTITIAAPQAANKSQTVTLNLTINAGEPVLTELWPSQVTQGSPPMTITLKGSNFYTGTVVKAGTTTLSTSVIGANVMTAVLPASLLAQAGDLDIVATNPGPGGGDSLAETFTVLSSDPSIVAVVNAASFLGGTVAPGEMVTIFGANLGPEALTTFAAPSPGGTIATLLAGTRVLFDTTEAPIIYTMSGQVTVMTPYGVAGATSVQVKVEYGGVQSAPVTIAVADSAPGIYTAAGTGSGQIAAFNYDESTTAYTLNTETTGAPKGSIVIFYLTGEGTPVEAATDGAIVTAPASALNPAVSVLVGGQDATVLYVGGSVGLVSGLVQINLRLPTAVAAGKNVPIQVTVNGLQSPPGTTLTIK